MQKEGNPVPLFQDVALLCYRAKTCPQGGISLHYHYRYTRRQHVYRASTDMGPRTSTGCQGRLETILGARHGCTYQAQISVRHANAKHAPPTHARVNSQPGQTSTGEVARRDLRAELFAAEEEARDKKRKAEGRLPVGITAAAGDEETLKRRKLLQEALELDKDDDEDEDEPKNGERDTANDKAEEESEEESEDEDDTDELLRELEKIKRERAEEKARQEREQLASQAAQLESPGLNTTVPGTFSVKKRWDDGGWVFLPTME